MNEKEGSVDRFRKAVANRIYPFRKQLTPTPFADRRVVVIDSDVEKTAANPLSYMRGWKGIQRLNYVFGDAVDIVELQKLACTPTPNMCINRIATDVSTTQWEITPLSKEDAEKPTDVAKDHARFIQNWLMDGLNDNGESFQSILHKVTRDISILDAGLIQKEYANSGNRSLVQLWSGCGGLYLKEMDSFQRIGIVQDVFRKQQSVQNFKVGYWFNPWYSSENNFNIPFEPHEIIYMMQYPRSDIPYGSSSVQALRVMLSGLMYGEEFYQEFWREGGVGNVMISTEQSMTDPQYAQWSDRLRTEMKAKLIKMIPLDSNPKVQTMMTPIKEIGWLETRSEYRSMVIAMFNVTSEVLGFTGDIHKATAESQRSVYIERGLWPKLKLLEWYINKQIIEEFFAAEDPEHSPHFMHGHKGKWAGATIDCMFRFKLYDPIGDKQQLEVDEKQLLQGLTTVNDIRRRNGLKELSWGDINPQFLLNPQQWSQSWMYQAFTDADWKKLTGCNAPDRVAQIPAAVKPAATPEETVKAYKESRTS